MTVSLGQSFPLHAGASSKAFLAFLDPAEIDRYIGRNTLSSLTAATVVDPRALRDDLAAIRRNGCAITFGERQSGAASVAAPVRSDAGIVGVISVCGPLERFSERADEFANALLEATSALSERLGYSPATAEQRSGVTVSAGNSLG